MVIRFTDDIKSRSTGNTPANKEKRYTGFLRLKIWTGSNKVRIKADRCNPNALEGEKKKQAMRVSGKNAKSRKQEFQRDRERVDNKLDVFAICHGS